jgi:hypothetical protein
MDHMDEPRSTENCYLSSSSGALLCSLEPFRMLTSTWALLPVLGYYGSSDTIASHVARLPCYQDIADARRARTYFKLNAGIKVTKKRSEISSRP